ncbi:hypothetical protein PCASD_20183 [Puccinia coronata f. sp. avenae]|uniref:Uncharacterized protein n=1 Tax=Puccinia coronata f. sp. avenae TaxID=200324 RepID=A0A2N5TMM3_9BASI|nr:hypothetical protein PCASD_21638 [Puccinia coronata f. sp. avenae]PLW26658.1 hypothetical protein PCASD_20183 [Puccinia coronata f. sp. avenae]
MTSTLLSFTLIAISFATSSQTSPVNNFNVDNFFKQISPADNFVPLHSGHLPGYNNPVDRDGYLHVVLPRETFPPAPAPGTASHEAFEGLPKVQNVVDAASVAITHQKAPLSADNLEDWKYIRSDMAQVSEDELRDAGELLLKKFASGFSDSKKQEGVRNYVWSLLQSKRNPNEIWWKKTLVDAGSEQKKGFVDLVRLGDTLSFGDQRAGFEIPRKDLNKVAHDLANILIVDGEAHTRIKALPIDSLMSYKDDDSIPMYQSRVGQVMNYLLQNFDNKYNHEEKLDVMNKLYLFIGSSPDAARQWANKALLLPKNTNALEALISNPKSYDNTFRLLNLMKD